MFNSIKQKIIEQTIWAERNLKGKTGSEKKAAVVKKLDDLIVLPGYLEWLDDIIIAKLVDLACEKLNDFAGHNFGEKDFTEAQEKKLAQALPDAEEVKQ